MDVCCEMDLRAVRDRFLRWHFAMAYLMYCGTSGPNLQISMQNTDNLKSNGYDVSHFEKNKSGLLSQKPALK